MKASALASLGILVLVLAACNQTGAGSVASGVASALDPTGLSGAAVDMARNAEAEADASRVDFTNIAPRLADIAAGDVSQPNFMAAFDQEAVRIMAEQSAKMAQSAAYNAADAALTGGLSLPGSAYNLAMQGAGNAMLAGQLASVRAQMSASIAAGEAQQRAEQLVPDADRPSEARAVLAILNGSAGSSAAWQNPATGASGKVTLQKTDRSSFGGLDCRSFAREWRSGETVRRGDMLACRDKGVWYALS
ncbi:surface antigen [Microvirga lupini]|uniref:Surface antigen n=1 Tax=Microvirga lupini TaxID=420324 RepID=A0A7W4VP27_9HYPH|nr:RT0821/Lpp0805 family surface protein [Microvirga lupini]MBB3020252.1 surface antigen [Microvirga lupini]